MTGFYRDGCCNIGQEDFGSHTVCAVLTSAFLEFSKSRGNDLRDDRQGDGETGFGLFPFTGGKLLDAHSLVHAYARPTRRTYP